MVRTGGPWSPEERTMHIRLGHLVVGLFASILTHQLQTYVSWRPDPMAMATDRQSTGADSPTACRACPGSTSVESTGMVPSAAGDSSKGFTPDPQEGELHHSHTQGQSPRGGAPTSRVDFLRQHYKDYKDCQVSKGATKLLLPSWRQKSSKTYSGSESAGVDCDPVSCSIGEAINFLAHLFEQGYQYCSVNSYQSAMSSVHEKVDGYEVGQHPMVSMILKETWDVSKVTAYIEA